MKNSLRYGICFVGLILMGLVVKGTMGSRSSTKVEMNLSGNRQVDAGGRHSLDSEGTKPLSQLEQLNSNNGTSEVVELPRGSGASGLSAEQIKALELYNKKKSLIFGRPNLNNDENGLEDIELLRSFEPILKMVFSGGSREEQFQGMAVEMLLDARLNKRSEVALDVLTSVIEDPQIEDSSLQNRTRERLAEIKADILYHWSAHEEGVSNTIESLLPGPVSKRIWDNVVKAQEQNQKESLALAR